MSFTLQRVLLYVRDVDALAQFYATHFSLTVTESIAGDWAVLDTGGAQLALHRVGQAWRGASTPGEGSNAKLVFTVTEDLAALRQRLLDARVAMRDIKIFEGFPMQLCDGTDPEGNVFQLCRYN